MNSIETLRQLLTYNDWANRRVIESLKNAAGDSARGLRAMAHLLIAEKMWLIRLLRNEDTSGFDFWQGSTLEECIQLADEVSGSYLRLLHELTEEGLNSVATYKNSRGVEYQTPYRDILQHVVIHSAYHRGQVAMAMREGGGEPAYTDYIAFVRETPGPHKPSSE
jgi:uncharacterized damage-inducible protein DinB